MMEPFGNVLHAVVLLDMTTGQSRGFGFVHMDNADSASAAASGMTGKVCPQRMPPCMVHGLAACRHAALTASPLQITRSLSRFRVPNTFSRSYLSH